MPVCHLKYICKPKRNTCLAARSVVASVGAGTAYEDIGWLDKSLSGSIFFLTVVTFGGGELFFKKCQWAA